jgi:hypothetical protein
MEVIARDGEAVHLRAGHLDALLVLGVIDFAGDGLKPVLVVVAAISSTTANRLVSGLARQF